jgi:hypothetical protein
VDKQLLLVFFFSLVAAIFCLPQTFSYPRAIKPYSIVLKSIGVVGMGLGIYAAGNKMASPIMHLVGFAFGCCCWTLANHVQSRGQGTSNMSK